MEKVKNELCITFSGLSDDINTRSKNRKTDLLEYKNNMENLKSTGENCFIRKYISLTIDLKERLYVCIFMIWHFETYVWAVKNWQ
jgi:hypothetical protein